MILLRAISIFDLFLFQIIPPTNATSCAVMVQHVYSLLTFAMEHMIVLTSRMKMYAVSEGQSPIYSTFKEKVEFWEESKYNL